MLSSIIFAWNAISVLTIRTLNEMKSLMRLDDIIMHSTQKVSKLLLASLASIFSGNLLKTWKLPDLKLSKNPKWWKLNLFHSDHFWHISFQIEIMEFTSEDKEKIEPVHTLDQECFKEKASCHIEPFQILEWCMKFKTTPHQMMNGSAYWNNCYTVPIEYCEVINGLFGLLLLNCPFGKCPFLSMK